jgi:two-component system, OmpR family, alkaline phosphatase synthesis response regulator PhoP
MENYKILIVDDEPDMLEFISYNLRNNEFDVFTASNGFDAIKMAKEIKPHLVLLDVMMPGMDGISTCEELRKIADLEQTVIAFLTARGEEYSQIAGFEAGGDDYINKPIRPKLLYSRIKALLKRSGKSINTNQIEEKNQKLENIIETTDIVIDKERYIVLKNNVEMALPRKEFELLLLLISKPDKVFTREQIYKEVWGDNVVVSDRTIDVHIRKIREKLGDNYIKTIKGVGYKFVE